jgi:hypothetical protein
MFQELNRFLERQVYIVQQRSYRVKIHLCRYLRLFDHVVNLRFMENALFHIVSAIAIKKKLSG